ncbi:RteC domain-containing protein [Flavobacterium sp. XS2P12]|uniref:RteC domain-containing protein n=1 Tax=Flavobacterium melibiosi TaxID=3398734 RepID=UPI003A8C093F
MQIYCDAFFCEFESEIEKIKNTTIDPISQAKQVLQYIQVKLKELFKWLKKYIFNSIEEEIHFFKELKFKITSKYIFYKKILDIESNSPSNSKKLKIRHYEKELNICFQFSKKDKEFYKYFRSGSSYNDHLYFVRNSDKQIINSDIVLINCDKRLCTSHDLKVASIIANDILEIYLEEKIDQINNICSTTHPSKTSKLTWTGTKIEIVELIYSLYYQKTFNGGKAEIKEIAEEFSRAFNIQLDNSIYRCFTDIKNRPDPKGKFLNGLSENLDKNINDEFD